MAFVPETFDRKVVSGDSLRTGEIHKRMPLISPANAWRILCRRTGGEISRSTFYRWLESGKIYSLRMGSRLYIPWRTLEEVINRCLDGEPL